MVKKLLIASTLLLGACSGGNYWSNWEPSINHRATMIRCVDWKIDDDPKIECSSTNIDEQEFFCDRKGKEEVNYFIRNFWHPLTLSPFRTEIHEANMIEQSCLQSTGVMFDNGAQIWGYND